MRLLQEMGFEVHYASNFETIVYGRDNDRVKALGLICHHIPFDRRLLCRTNYHAYKQLKKLMAQENFLLVHCHMPFTGVAARLAAKRTGTAPVLYTGHGFHFFTGAPWKNWVFYPVERWMARYTDRLITINEEDFARAKTFPVRGNVCRIHGVGIDCDKFLRSGQRGTELSGDLKMDAGVSGRKHGSGHEKEVSRKDGGWVDSLKGGNVLEEETEVSGHTEFTVATVGELAPGKNHQAVIRALPSLPDVRYEIYGEGSCMESLVELAKQCGVEDRVCFAGYCSDIVERLHRVDAFVFPSLREGMPVAVMEAMASGLPVIALDIRGCRELVVDGKGGFLLKTDVPEALAQSIQALQGDRKRTKEMGDYNRARMRKYDKAVVREEMREIYRGVLE